MGCKQRDAPGWLETHRKTASTRSGQTDIKNGRKRIKNQGSRQQQGLGPGHLISQRSESVHYNMDEMESDTDSNLSALFQDSDDSSVEIEREIWEAPRLTS